MKDALKTTTRFTGKLWALSLVLVPGLCQAQIFSDEFSGTSLSPAWTVERGYESVNNGWVTLHGSTPGSRDSMILAGEGSNWSNYELTTDFVSDNGPGGVDCSIICFRVQNQSGFAFGTFYSLYLFPSNSAGYPNLIQLFKYENSNVPVTLSQTSAGPNVINPGTNHVDLTVYGGLINLSINGQQCLSYNDPSPIQTGGIGLGGLWETSVSYDYVHVNTTPEPISVATMGLGLVGLVASRRRKASKR